MLMRNNCSYFAHKQIRQKSPLFIFIEKEMSMIVCQGTTDDGGNRTQDPTN
jgi:hypothetical protein